MDLNITMDGTNDTLYIGFARFRQRRRRRNVFGFNSRIRSRAKGTFHFHEEYERSEKKRWQEEDTIDISRRLFHSLGYYALLRCYAKGSHGCNKPRGKANEPYNAPEQMRERKAGRAMGRNLSILRLENGTILVEYIEQDDVFTHLLLLFCLEGLWQRPI